MLNDYYTCIGGEGFQEKKPERGTCPLSGANRKKIPVTSCGTRCTWSEPSCRRPSCGSPCTCRGTPLSEPPLSLRPFPCGTPGTTAPCPSRSCGGRTGSPLPLS